MDSHGAGDAPMFDGSTLPQVEEPMTLTASDWTYKTSEDRSLSLFFVSGGSGNIYLTNESTQQQMVIPYIYGGAGESKGVDIGFSFSDVQNMGSGTFMTIDNHILSDTDFPCMGTAMSTGASIGAGYSATIWTFGVAPPFAFLKTTGGFLAVGGGVGVSAVVVRFGAATIGPMPPEADPDNVPTPAMDNMGSSIAGDPIAQ
jgi:hypothetical protein